MKPHFPRRLGRSVTVLCALFLTGCATGPRERSNQSARFIRSGDQVYSQRIDRAELGRAIEYYQQGTLRYPSEPRPLGRLARAFTVSEYGHGGSVSNGYESARSYGLQCLMLEASFGGLVSAAGGKLTRRAVETLERDRIGCMTWTSIAWARWLVARDVVGASIDIEAVQMLAARAVEVFPTYDGGRPYAALGLALALPPSPFKPDLKAARVAFGHAARISPNRLTPIVDLAEFVSAPQGRESEWNALLNRVVSSDPGEVDTLENNAAIQRAEALLHAGLNTRWNE